MMTRRHTGNFSPYTRWVGMSNLMHGVKKPLRLIILHGILVLVLSCSQGVKNGKLEHHQARPESGFNFPYLLFVPDNMEQEKELFLVVEPNNSGFVSDDLEKHLEKAERTATRPFYTGNYISRKLKFPLLVPVFPRPESNWKIYTHAFDRDAALQKNNALERIDLQLLAMTEHARQVLSGQGFTLSEKLLMTGFSASGTFVNRFTAIHPERVLACAAGGLNGLLILPLEETEGEKLPFPIGVHDFEILFNKKFNAAAFRNTPQFLYMGENDDNDAVMYDDAYDNEEREIIFRILSKEMQPARWRKCNQIYTSENVAAEIITLIDTGHEHPDWVKDRIAEFFSTQIKK